jgi:hypothetical protein
MNESAVYNESDLVPFQQRVDELRQIVIDDSKSGKHPKAMTELCERQLNECGMPFRFLRTGFGAYLILQNADALLTTLKDSLSELSVELVPIHQKLVHLRRQLVALAANDHPSKTELKSIREELRKIDSLSGHFYNVAPLCNSSCCSSLSIVAC